MVGLFGVIVLGVGRASAAEGEAFHGFAGPIGDGPWTYTSGGTDTGCASAYDSESTDDEWYEYYQLGKTKFMTPGVLGWGAVKQWKVEVNEKSGAACTSTSGSPAQVVKMRRQASTGTKPENAGAKVVGAVKGSSFHSAGLYTVKASQDGADVGTADLWIVASGDNRIETFCTKGPLPWPKRKGVSTDDPAVSWVIDRVSGEKFTGACAEGKSLDSYVVTVNVDPPS